MAAPSSAHTMPSHSARAAPRIHPNMACGPPAALMMRGMVMNGPTPIMSIMFSAVAEPRPMPRTRVVPWSACPGGLGLAMAGAQQIHVQSDGPGDSIGKLAEESIAGVNVGAVAGTGTQQSAFARRFARVGARKQRPVVVVPLVHEVKPALLHPAIEIFLGDGIGKAEDAVIGLE